MDIEQAFQVANSALFAHNDKRLSPVEASILLGSLQRQTYEQIAEVSDYAISYVKYDVGPKLWKRLGQALGETVSKKTFQSALEHYWHQSLIGQFGTDETREVADQISVSQSVSQIDQLATPKAAVPHTDWGEGVDVSNFYGRSVELETLTQWIVKDRCHLVVLLGMGGIGKTALSVKVAHQIINASEIRGQKDFEFVIWRSLRNAPPLDTLLADIVTFLSRHQAPKTDLPLFMHHLQSSRCLVILDNLETILQSGECAGHFRKGYENYGELLRLVSESTHQSCVLLTSREKAAVVATYEGFDSQVRSLQLSGSEQAVQSILKTKGLVGSKEQKKMLGDRYGNSPLALKIVATSIQDVFAGDIGEFLVQDAVIFNGIRRLLDQQFQRLNPLETSVMYWLAINREWTSIAELHTDTVPTVSKSSLLEVLESLSWRSLIETRSGSYTQQPVVMEYVTERLIEQILAELQSDELSLFLHYALIKTTVKDYIRGTQVRLILGAIAERFCQHLGVVSIEAANANVALQHQILKTLRMLRCSAIQSSAYGGGNLINLCNYLQLDLTGYDFSQLSIWHAALQEANLHHLNFAYADLQKSVFMQTFSAITYLTFSPDGSRLATADVEGQIRLWRSIDYQPLLTLVGHRNWVWSLAFSADGTLLASGSGDQTIKLWQVQTGELLTTLQEHTGQILSVAFSPDGTLLASGSGDQTIKLWDMKTRQSLTTLSGHTGWVRSVAFNANGTLLASGSDDQSIKLWRIDPEPLPVSSLRSIPKENSVRMIGQLLSTLAGHSNAVLCLAFRPTSVESEIDPGPVQEMLVSGSADQSIKLWHISEVYPFNREADTWSTQGILCKTLLGHSGWVRSIQFSSNGQLLASGSDDQTVKLWHGQSGKLLKTLQGHTNWVWSVAFKPDGFDSTSDSLSIPNQESPLLSPVHPVILASGGYDQTVKFWDGQSGKLLKNVQGHTNWVLSVKFSPDGQLLASGSDDQTIKLWNVRTGQLLKTLQEHTGWVRALAFSPDGMQMASASDDRTLKLWDIARPVTQEASPFFSVTLGKTLQGHTNGIWSVDFSPDTIHLASGSVDQTIGLWDIQTGERLQTLVGHGNWVRSLKFSPDGTHLASGSYDQTIKLWHVPTGELLQTLEGHTKGVWSVDFSPNGIYLASGSYDQTIKLWHVPTGELLQTLEGHTNGVWSVDFSPDGIHLASGSYDQTIKLWHMQTGELLHTLEGHTSWVLSVAFDPDGTYLASGSADESIRLWEVQTGKCLQTLKSERPYEGMDITDVTGLTTAQKVTLKALGAIEQSSARLSELA